MCGNLSDITPNLLDLDDSLRRVVDIGQHAEYPLIFRGYLLSYTLPLRHSLGICTQVVSVDFWYVRCQFEDIFIGMYAYNYKFPWQVFHNG